MSSTLFPAPHAASNKVRLVSACFRQRAVYVGAALLLLTLGVELAFGQVAARDIARQSFGSVVLIAVNDVNGQPLAIGSGFFVRQGVVATNVHVIQGGSTATVKLVGRGRAVPATGVIGIDADQDIALLAVPGLAAPALPLGDSDALAVGDEVYVVGNPEGLEGTFSEGIVSGIRSLGENTVLQITAPISPGSSGGPVLDVSGRVVGVAFASYSDGQNLNFAIPVKSLRTLIESTDPSEVRSLASLGEATKTPTPTLATEGVEGRQFAWTYNSDLGVYSFTLRNRIPERVSQVSCLVIFYDAEGEPLDIGRPIFCGGSRSGATIEPSLAIRLEGEVDGSVQKLTERVEIRVLDFRIIR